jgi:hypothetical protein
LTAADLRNNLAFVANWISRALGGARRESGVVTPEVRAASKQLAQFALLRVQEPATKRVRAEDYIAVLAAVTGEAAIVASGIDIESFPGTPGQGVFGNQINEVLSGDQADVGTVPSLSVLGILLSELVPATVPREYFGSIERLYRLVAANVGGVAWGTVATSVPDDNRPSVIPLQVAFELRPAVDALMTQARLSPSLRHVLCALALADGLRQVRQAIDMRVAITLALEVAFGTAKMLPVSKRAFAEVKSQLH